VTSDALAFGLQMPVPDVKAVLTAPDSGARNHLIVEHLARLEAELADTAAVVAGLRNLLAGPEAPPDVEHRTVPPAAAIGIQETIDREDLAPWWQGALGELSATLPAQGLSPTGPSGGLYASEIFQYGRGEATMFIPTEDRLERSDASRH
jgi:hypothetical protein